MAITFIYLIFKTQKESQDKTKAKLSLLFILKFKSDTNTLLFNKMECYKNKETKSYSRSVGDFIWFLRRWMYRWRASL